MSDSGAGEGSCSIASTSAPFGLMLSNWVGSRVTSRPLTGFVMLPPQAVAARHKADKKKMCLSFVFIARKIVAPARRGFHFTAQTYGKEIYLAIHRTKFSINIF